MKNPLLLSWLALTLLCYPAFSQNRTVSGQVTTYEDGSPLPAVSVVVKGTTTGTSTDFQGRYQLDVPPQAVLIFSFIGFNTQEVQVGDRTVLDVKMTADVKTLNELVVVGYGTQQKKDLTGSVSSVSSKDIQNVPVASFESAIQGRNTGVQVSSPSGKVGQGIQIRVRGASSITASNQPLYVVDGIPVTQQSVADATTEDTNPLADLNTNDIESIQVLKDASSAAIYGSRASNGVVLITTKRGKSGRTNFNINYSAGRSTPTGYRKFLNRAEYIEFFTEAATNVGEDIAEVWEDNTGYSWAETLAQNVNTDWQKEAFQKAGFQQLDVTASGGNDKSTFYAGLSYLDQDGILLANGYQRFSGRLNLDQRASDRMRFGINLNMVRSVNNRVDSDNSFTNPLQANALPPIQPAIDPETGDYNLKTLYDNPLYQTKYQFQKATTYRNFATLYGSYTFLPGLTFRSEFGADILNQQEEYYNGRNTPNGAPTGNGNYRTVTVLNYTTNNTLTYNRLFDEVHDLEVLGGMSYQESNTETSQVTGQGFPNDQFKKLSSATTITFGSSTGTGFSYLSYFARANYKYNGKYLLSLSGRSDGSSRFGADRRFGFFPAASLGWIVSEEAFMNDTRVLSFLKVRASYGITGNSEIDDFAPRGQVVSIFNGSATGLIQTTVPNPNLKWETTAQLDLGLDVGLFSDRISVTADYYSKKTTDLLLQLPIPNTSGFNTQYQNIGNLENKGVELSLTTRNLTGEFTWTTNFNISRNVNKVTNMAGTNITPGGRILSSVREGQPIGIFWGKKFIGVNPDNGDALYEGEGGVPVNNITQAVSQIIGNPNPDFFGGLTNTFTYKGFELNVFLQFVSGNDVYNMAGVFQSVSGDFFDNQTRDQLNRWREPGDITNVPQARFDGANGGGASSRWVEDGSYLRFKTVTLGYNFPKSLVNKARLNNVRVYVTGQNLLTFTRYSGYDPEVSYLGAGPTNQTSNFQIGHDFYTPPQARTLIVGINLGF
jgi:TonB-dependent starch-binding outer membrane protein SusC